MKKIIFLLFIALLSLPSVTAVAGEINVLDIHCKSGENISIMLTDNPVVRFVDFDLFVKTDKNEVCFPSEEVERFTYRNVDPSKIDPTVISDMLLRFENESLMISNLAPLAKVSAFNLEGMLVCSAVTDTMGNAVLQFTEMSSGVYIVKTPSVSFKILKP